MPTLPQSFHGICACMCQPSRYIAIIHCHRRGLRSLACLRRLRLLSIRHFGPNIGAQGSEILPSHIGAHPFLRIDQDGPRVYRSCQLAPLPQPESADDLAHFL